MRSANSSRFDNFDPDNFDASMWDSFDPFNNATGPDVAAAVAVNKMQINITIVNSTNSVKSVELFSAFDSVLHRRKAEYVDPPFLMIPATSREGLRGLVPGIEAGDYVPGSGFAPGTVCTTQEGDLLIVGELNADGTPKGGSIKVSCNEYPYVSLLDTTRLRAFQVTRLRYTVGTDLQIDNNITHFKKTMGGGVKENTISPRAYFKPNQYQGKTIDIDQAFTIDGQSGLLLRINGNETVRLSLFINV